MKILTIKNVCFTLGFYFSLTCLTYAQTPGLEADINTVALWHFDEGFGNTVYDDSGNENHGTINGATWTDAGKFDGGLIFDGVDDYIKVLDNQSLDLIDELTIEAWINGNGADFLSTLRSLPGDIPGGLPKLQIVGDKIYYSFNAGVPRCNVWTAVTDIDGSGWTPRQQTNNLRTDCQIKHLVVGDKMYFTWHTSGEWYGARMNLDGSNFIETKLSSGVHNHY